MLGRSQLWPGRCAAADDIAIANRCGIIVILYQIGNYPSATTVIAKYQRLGTTIFIVDTVGTAAAVSP
jgi:hypothetical protein